MNPESAREEVVRQYFELPEEEVEAPFLAEAARELFDRGYDKLSVAALFLQAAAVLVPATMTPREFAALSERGFALTQSRLDLLESEEVA